MRMEVKWAVVPAVALLLAFPTARATDVKWIRTAKDSTDRLTPQSPLTFSADFQSPITISISRNHTFQAILGFGGAFTDSASYVFSKLKSTLQSQVLDMYFSESGLQYNMARLPIGACDFSLNHYTYDNTSGDVNLTDFSIKHDTATIIPFIHKALETRRKWNNDTLNIVASPWTAPKWMKTNNHAYCPTSCIHCDIQTKYQNAWANYFARFVSAYMQEGINIWGVTVQNEPEACPLIYEGTHWTPETQRDFLATQFGPVLSKIHPDMKILIYDHNKDHVVKWAQTILSQNEAAQFVWGTAVHWYSGDQFDNLNTTHHLFPDYPILATEATVKREKNPKDPLWSNGEHYAHDIMGDMNNWVVGFIDWNLILDMLGGPNHAGPDECEGLIKCGSDAMLLADTDSQVVYPQIFYYYVGHFSKYVPRGSLRILRSVSGSNSLESVAFVTPDETVVVVVMNTSDQPVDFKLMDVTKSVQSVKITALPHSIQTFLYQ